MWFFFLAWFFLIVLANLIFQIFIINPAKRSNYYLKFGMVC